jgi:hypothetical protein
MCPVCDAESVGALEFQRFVLKIFFCSENLLKIFWEAKDWPTLKTSAQLLLFASLSEISSCFYYKLITCDPLETQSFLVAQLWWMWRNDLEGRRTAADHESGQWSPPPRRTWLMLMSGPTTCVLRFFHHAYTCPTRVHITHDEKIWVGRWTSLGGSRVYRQFWAGVRKSPKTMAQTYLYICSNRKIPSPISHGQKKCIYSFSMSQIFWSLTKYIENHIDICICKQIYYKVYILLLI